MSPRRSSYGPGVAQAGRDFLVSLTAEQLMRRTSKDYLSRASPVTTETLLKRHPLQFFGRRFHAAKVAIETIEDDARHLAIRTRQDIMGPSEQAADVSMVLQANELGAAKGLADEPRKRFRELSGLTEDAGDSELALAALHAIVDNHLRPATQDLGGELS